MNLMDFSAMCSAITTINALSGSENFCESPAMCQEKYSFSDLNANALGSEKGRFLLNTEDKPYN